MGQVFKKFAVVICALVLVACLAGACYGRGAVGASIDETRSEELQAGDGLSVVCSMCGVTVTADEDATEVTAHLYGTYVGLGSEPELTVTRSGDTVTVRAGRHEPVLSGWNLSLKLDVVVPAGFQGDFNCESSAGAVTIDADMAVKSFRAHSSAGAVRVKDVKSPGAVEVSSSAGAVETGSLEASSADIHTSAGSVRVKACRADTIRLQSSAGSVSAEGLSGKVDASSSAGAVDIALSEVRGDVDATSSAGRVSVTIPKDSSARIDASASAGGVSVSGLQLNIETQKKSKIVGTAGDGRYKITAHSSAGSVEIAGE
jgi:hypothetical protein